MLSDSLLNSIEKGTLSHAYLFLNRDMALEFVRILRPQPVDLLTVSPTNGRIHILTEDIEKLQEEIKLKPFGDRRVIFIDGADSMMAAPQNKLLKTLEEPAPGNILVLYAERRDALLPTVLSRCTEVAAPDKELETDESSLSLAKEFWALKKSGGQFFQLKALLSDIIDDKENSRQKALAFLDGLESVLREDLIKTLDSDSLGKAIKLTEETRKNVQSSYSVSIAMKALALNI